MRVQVNWHGVSFWAAVAALVLASWHGSWTLIAHGKAAEWHWQMWQAFAVLVGGPAAIAVAVGIVLLVVNGIGVWVNKASEAPLVQVKRDRRHHGPTVF